MRSRKAPEDSLRFKEGLRARLPEQVLSRRSYEMKCFSPRLKVNRKSSAKPRSWLLALIRVFLIGPLM
jgi:hypothetical protein